MLRLSVPLVGRLTIPRHEGAKVMMEFNEEVLRSSNEIGRDRGQAGTTKRTDDPVGFSDHKRNAVQNRSQR